MKTRHFFTLTITVLFGILLFVGCTSAIKPTTQTGMPEHSFDEPVVVESTDDPTEVVQAPAATDDQSNLFSANSAQGMQTVPRPSENVGTTMTLEEVTKLALGNRALLTQYGKAIKELSLMVVLNRFWIQNGYGTIVPIRHFFAYGSTAPSKQAEKDYRLLCRLQKAGKIQIMKGEGYTDDSGSQDANARIVWQRIDNMMTLLSDSCCEIDGIELRAYAKVSFQGSKKDNRSFIIYIKLLESFTPEDLKDLTGDTLPNLPDGIAMPPKKEKK